MFDMGFFELLIVAVVGLFVIGPERLPTTIRMVALWVGRIKRSLVETRREIEQQLGADEIRRELHNEQVMRNWEKMKDTRAELEAKIKAWETGDTIEHKGDEQKALQQNDAAVAEQDKAVVAVPVAAEAPPAPPAHAPADQATPPETTTTKI